MAHLNERVARGFVLIRLATRGSPLAMWQARHVASLLRRHHPRLRVQFVIVQASGDGDHATPLYRMNNVGVFVKEVHDAVCSGRADAGVHSCKDLPTTEPDGVTLAAILARADARDVLVAQHHISSVSDLPPGAVIGTSSLRRQAQLIALRPDLRFVSIRGNVATRLRKVHAGEVSATVMAMAGLARLGLLRQARALPLDPWNECTPAPGQGAIAVDCRTHDVRVHRLLACLHHHETATAVGIERTVLAGLSGGCSLPLGCYALRSQGRWRLRVRLGNERDDQGLRELALTGMASTLADRSLAVLRG